MRLAYGLAPAVALAAANLAAAQTTFSIDYKGPTIAVPSPTPITEGDILMPAPGLPAPGPLPPPLIVIPGGPGGLGLATWPGCVGHPPGVTCGVEVDALSYGMDGPVAPNMPPGSFKFSVDQYATGMPSPVPPNVGSESPAPIGEAAGDVFMDLGLPPGPLCPMPALGGNVAFSDGNGLPGPSPFSYPGVGLIEPNSRAFGPACMLPDAGDNLDALDVDGPIGPLVYFSVDGPLPDVCGFPGGATGPILGLPPAAVLMSPIGGAPVIYAPPPALGLDLLGPFTDDLDALILFENGLPGFMPAPGPYLWAPFGPGDMLFFSVTPTSAVVGAPASNCGGLPISPGDILMPPIPGGVSPFPAIFIAAENLGLATLRSGLPRDDNIDALDVTRVPLFDCDGNGIEDMLDIYAGGAADCNGNGIIDTCEFMISTYCTPATTTNGCSATMTWAGTPTASLSCPFVITATGVEGLKAGLVFYGISGPKASPWGTGFLCVKAPTQRTPAQSSGGTSGLCDGTLTLDWNAYISTHPVALGQPIFPGQVFWAQAWFRDPPSPKTTNLSDALTFSLAP